MRRYLFGRMRVRAGRGQALHVLTLLAVALGVASVVCIQILNQNAISSFAGTVRAISGEADLSVLGRFDALDEQQLANALRSRHVRGAWPLVRASVVVDDPREEGLEVVGFDLMSPQALPWRGDAWEVTAALSIPGWVAVSPDLAREMGWEVGQNVVARVGERRVTLHIGALVDFRSVNPSAGRRLSVMDIAQAQHLLGRSGQIDQIDVVLRDGASPEAVGPELEALLGPQVRVVTPEQRTQNAAGLLAAFRFNLTALSLVSLLVGTFLVHSSTTASLVRRRREFGVLRCLGATRRHIIGLILGEVAVLGLMGVVVGVPVGYLAAAMNVDVVSRTLTSIYLLREIETLELSGWIYGLGAMVGIGGAVAGALFPALDVSRQSPVALLAASTLHQRTEAWASRLFALGVGVVVVAGVWYTWLAGAWPPAGFLLGSLLLGALSLATPLVVLAICRAGTVRGFGFTYSLRALAARLQTTSFAVSALAMAVSMLVGITIMIASFRHTLDAWIGATIQADIYVTAEVSGRAGARPALDGVLAAAIAGHPAVAMVDRLRRAQIFTGERRITLAAVDMHLAAGGGRFVMLDGPAGAALARLRQEGGVLISEPLASKTGLRAGDRLPLSGPDGDASFPVVGVFADYGSETGTAFVDLADFEAFLGPGDPNSMALYLRVGENIDDVVTDLRRRHGRRSQRVRSNRGLRTEILALFDQTFAVTAVVRFMSLVIAAAGVTLSLLVMAQHRVAELALYRALGARRRQIFRVFLAKGVGMGLIGLGIGGVGGVVLAIILVHAINPAYFGWTLQLSWPWLLLARQAVTVLAACALAAIYPALRASASPATEISRDSTG